MPSAIITVLPVIAPTTNLTAEMAKLAIIAPNNARFDDAAIARSIHLPRLKCTLAMALPACKAPTPTCAKTQCGALEADEVRVEFLGIKFVGLDAQHFRELGISVAYIAVVIALSVFLRKIARLVIRGESLKSVHARFWVRQCVSLVAAVALILGLLSIWFNDPTRLATAFGLMSAGLAFALQTVITALAGYFVILRGSTFTVGDRISMGGVRGDVLRLGFLQTTIMEMGQPPAVQSAEPAVWVRSRQFTGRIATVSNSQIFKEPVFNYTRDFPFIWEEMMIPITFKADRDRAESILLQAAHQYANEIRTISADSRNDLQKRFRVEPIDLEPRVFFRITDNWLELSLRFIVGTHLIRVIKDKMSRFIVVELEKAGIGIASATYDIVGFPTIDVRSSGK